ncbi:hypothetical protein GOQ29_09250 [Clostridium sp. D2Q-14]|uniref:hypothetical protein n=1 Tax=Anaeromonas gelatinilytica TaxID=2683194 RepID=UPI00193C53E2|nr:hypothetical protein [Anaeromonas gelatinilytica]MBS4535799.1 hypothetical protein [Anaeromonas gelatinilytica]
MVIYIMYIVIYVFFIYGIIEFIKNILLGYDIPKKTHKISIIVEDEKELEYIFLNLKDKFAPIKVYLDTEDEELMEMIRIAYHKFNIETFDIQELK